MCSAPEILQWLEEEEKSSGGELWRLGHDIWTQPELKFQEHKAHDILTDFLDQKGFKVQRNFILPTAFKAEVDLPGNKVGGPSVGLLCEYDALPDVGHACGHNLIAELGVGAALAIRAAGEAGHLMTPSRGTEAHGKLVVLGTPGEEGGGGKIQLLKGGAFHDLDAVLMAHPCAGHRIHAAPKFITSLGVEVEFKGRAAHAAGRPWEGVNALDAAVACYVNVGLLKQQLKPDWRINGIITNGGKATNVIPHESSLKFLLRTPESQDSDVLLDRFRKCVTGAAEATGCQSECQISWDTHYKDVIQNTVLEDCFRKHSTDLDVLYVPDKRLSVSTDFGNVSYVVPGLHPSFGIGTEFFPHTAGFANRAGSLEAQEPTFRAAATIAATVVDLLKDPSLLEAARIQHGIDTRKRSTF